MPSKRKKTKSKPKKLEVTNKLVADKLSVTEDTIKMHVKSILSKLGANDRTHAVTIAVKRGILNL